MPKRSSLSSRTALLTAQRTAQFTLRLIRLITLVALVMSACDTSPERLSESPAESPADPPEVDADLNTDRDVELDVDLGADLGADSGITGDATIPSELPDGDLIDMGSLDMGSLDMSPELDLEPPPDMNFDMSDMSSDMGSLPTGEACVELQRRRFTRELWPGLFEPRCLGCHNTQGIASASALRLVTASEREDWVDQNLETLRGLAQTRLAERDDRALLELKPTHSVPHGGALVIEEGGALHALLMGFIEDLNREICDEEPPVEEIPYYQGVRMIEPLRLLRRLALTLNGRLPTEAERDAVEELELAGVEGALTSMLDDERFLVRLKEAFNDILLTRGYDAVAGAVLSYSFFTNRHWPQWEYMPPESYTITNLYDQALRDEPVALIAHLVKNDLPFTEVLTADYAMVSPYTARGYGVFESVQGSFEDPDDPFEYIPVQLPPQTHRNGQVQMSPTGYYPHAGVLTTPQFLHRYPSTDTNRNRARARHFYKLFLGFDIMTSAPPIGDSAAVTARFDNPTFEAPQCTSCHTMLDPIAGLFQDYNNAGEFHLRGEPWHTDMFGPGFEGVDRPEADAWRSLQWLGARAAADERFPVAMAEHAYYLLTQERVMSPPSEEDEYFTARLRGYQAQRQAISEAARVFREGGYQFKDLVRSLALLEWYRADGVEMIEDEPERVIELEPLGLAALLTPEQLIRKTEVIFGVGLPIDPRDPDQRRSTYLLYGGLNYDEITERGSTPSGAMGSLMRKHAHRIACTVALKWFWEDAPGPEPLFPSVDEDTLDESLIRDNLVHLHRLVLGQELDPLSNEINRSYTLFSEIQQEGALRVEEGEDARLTYECRREQTVPDDRDYVMRSWQAIITYLLRRPEYLLQ